MIFIRPIAGQSTFFDQRRLRAIAVSAGRSTQASDVVDQPFVVGVRFNLIQISLERKIGVCASGLTPPPQVCQTMVRSDHCRLAYWV